MISSNFHKFKSLFIKKYLSFYQLLREIYFYPENSKISNFLDIYFESFFISLRAFLPSLRVLNVNQKREEIIKRVSMISEIKVKSI